MQHRMEVAHGLRLANQERLRELAHAHADEVTVFCAHDAVELRAAQGRHTGAGISRVAPDDPSAPGAGR